MGLQDKRFSRFIASFQYAAFGIAHTFKTERNFKIHVVVALIVILFAYFLSITRFEWLILIIVISFTVILELVNTAIENVVNLITNDYHPYAKAAKDIAAGAVLISAIMSVMIGCIIFIPRLLELFIK
ncbi:diacylglycerol kinase [Pueribacillus sp. YX66]|uniref:diacylglycerol kinase n=1 Tax=Pueribacillus sp. YX66 TaxID=3229242 RepID=UPI00358D7886